MVPCKSKSKKKTGRKRGPKKSNPGMEYGEAGRKNGPKKPRKSRAR